VSQLRYEVQISPQKPTSPETMAAILNEDPPGISQVAANIPPAMQRVVHRCLEKNPEQRFQSASDLAFALDALSSTSEPIAGSVSAPATRRLKWGWLATAGPVKRLLRKWLPVVLVAVVLVALGFGWIIWKRKPADSGQMVQRQLTASTADNPIFGATISRDGMYLASRDKDGLSIEEIENGDVHKLPGTVGLQLQDWYPDGLHLLVTDGTDLWTLFAFSGEKHKLASGVVSADMSPDGSQILLFREQQPSELWTMPTAGGEPHVRISLGQGESFLTASWSPDGKAIADIRSSKGFGGSGTLEIRNLGDGKAHTLLTDPALDGGGGNTITWLPDGRILFGLFKRGITESDLWAVSLDSSGALAGKPVRITNTTGSYVGTTSVSRDGKRLVIMCDRNPFSIFVANLSKTGDKLEKPLRLTSDSWNNWPQAWTPDGETLFYVSVRNNQSLYKHRMSRDNTELFAGGADRYSAATVSPDGTWLIVTAKAGDSETRRLLRIPLSGGAPEPILTLAGRADVQCAYSGSRICVLSEAIGKQEVFSTRSGAGATGECQDRDTN
jgi:Tol biopolymer transport system component